MAKIIICNGCRKVLADRTALPPVVERYEVLPDDADSGVDQHLCQACFADYGDVTRAKEEFARTALKELEEAQAEFLADYWKKVRARRGTTNQGS